MGIGQTLWNWRGFNRRAADTYTQTLLHSGLFIRFNELFNRFLFFVVVIRQRQFTNYLTVNFKLRIILRSSWDLSPECSPLPGRTLLYKAEYLMTTPPCHAGSLFWCHSPCRTNVEWRTREVSDELWQKVFWGLKWYLSLRRHRNPNGGLNPPLIV